MTSPYQIGYFQSEIFLLKKNLQSSDVTSLLHQGSLDLLLSDDAAIRKVLARHLVGQAAEMCEALNLNRMEEMEIKNCYNHIILNTPSFQ